MASSRMTATSASSVAWTRPRNASRARARAVGEALTEASTSPFDARMRNSSGAASVPPWKRGRTVTLTRLVGST